MAAAGIALISLLTVSCGNKAQDPVDLITSAAVEETTTEAETTAEEVTETGEALESVQVEQAGPGAEAEYIYQQIDDDQVHKVTYWTDGETRRTDYFKNLYIPEWGIEKITLPSDLLEGEAYVLKPGEELTAENAKDDQVYDDSIRYDGNFSIKTTYELFRVWRVNVGRNVDLFSMVPWDVFLMVYPFNDVNNYHVMLDGYGEYIGENGERGYIIHVADWGHWEEKVNYKGSILVRVEDGIAHCIQYGDSTSYHAEMWDYILKTARFTKISEITRGEPCAANKWKQK